MDDRNQDEIIDDLLDQIANPIHYQHQQRRVFGPKGFRVTHETIDQVKLGPNNEPRNLIAENEYVLDCGHHARYLVAGICHFCDGQACPICLSTCSSCGLAACSQCRVSANFDGENKFYCRWCAEEIRRSLRLQAIGRGILAFFVKEAK